MKNYKIRVGIEEFIVEESDIPRIIDAMQNNHIVKLKCGMFRGSAILAVYECRETYFISSPKELVEAKLKIADCQICNGTGWKIIKVDGESMAKKCQCLLELSDKN